MIGVGWQSILDKDIYFPIRLQVGSHQLLRGEVNMEINNFSHADTCLSSIFVGTAKLAQMNIALKWNLNMGAVFRT